MAVLLLKHRFCIEHRLRLGFRFRLGNHHQPHGSHSAEQLVHGDAKYIRNPGQQSDVRAALTRLPLAHRLIGHIQFLSQRLLGQAQLFPISSDPFSKGHIRILPKD